MFGTIKDTKMEVTDLVVRVGVRQYIVNKSAVVFRGEGIFASDSEDCLKSMDESFNNYSHKDVDGKAVPLPWENLRAKHFVILKEGDGESSKMQCFYRRALLPSSSEETDVDIAALDIGDLPFDDAFGLHRLKIDTQMQKIFKHLVTGSDEGEEADAWRKEFFEGVDPEELDAFLEYITFANDCKWHKDFILINPAHDCGEDDPNALFQRRYNNNDNKAPKVRELFESAITPLPRPKQSNGKKRKADEQDPDPLVDAPDHVFSRVINGRVITEIGDLPCGSMPKATIVQDTNIVAFIFPTPARSDREPKTMIRASELAEISQYVKVEDTPAGMRNVILSVNDTDYKIDKYPCGYNHCVVTHAPLMSTKRPRTASEFAIEPLDDIDSAETESMTPRAAPKQARLMAA